MKIHVVSQCFRKHMFQRHNWFTNQVFSSTLYTTCVIPHVANHTKLFMNQRSVSLCTQNRQRLVCAHACVLFCCTGTNQYREPVKEVGFPRKYLHIVPNNH